MARVGARKDPCSAARAIHGDGSPSGGLGAGARAAGVAEAGREYISLPAPTTLFREFGSARSQWQKQE